MLQLVFIALLVLIVGLALANWQLWRIRRRLSSIQREIKTMGQGLTDLQAAISGEDTVIGQAIATLDTIPGLITAAQGSDDPDSALEALVADIKTHTANLTAAQAAASAAEQPPPAPVPLAVSPTSVTLAVGVASTAPLTISGGTAPYTFSGLPGGVTTDANNDLVADATTTAGTSTVTVSDSATPPNTVEVSVTIQ